MLHRLSWWLAFDTSDEFAPGASFIITITLKFLADFARGTPPDTAMTTDGGFDISGAEDTLKSGFLGHIGTGGANTFSFGCKNEDMSMRAQRFEGVEALCELGYSVVVRPAFERRMWMIGDRSWIGRRMENMPG